MLFLLKEALWQKNCPSTSQLLLDSSDIPLSPQTKVKNKGGRPKSPKKKGQFTLTMDPELYETLKAKAVEKQKSFSQLVTDVMLDFLNND